jgi:tRNA nucleotidyltransferase (CCA-adding enzyme)
MRAYLQRLPAEIQDLVQFAAEIAATRSARAYLVGGFVRDLLLKIPNLDLDITVEGDGIGYAEELGRRLNARIIRHRRFGTATLTLRHHLKIDVATVRKEAYPKPACLPEVSAGTLWDDLSRRDFTINAMAISLQRYEFGKLIDFFSSRQDLKDKKIRVLHEKSFIDDPTRITRAVRFEQRYNFKIEPETLSYIKEAAGRKMLEKVQPQRLRDELVLLLKEKQPLKSLRRIAVLTGFGFIHPHLVFNKETLGILDAVAGQIDWFGHTHLHRRKLDGWLIYFMGLIDTLKEEETRTLLALLALHRGEAKRVISIKEINQAGITRLCRKDTKPAELFALLEPLSYEAILFLKAKYRNRVFNENVEHFLEAYNGMRIHVGGDDLRRMGVSPGPEYQKIFSQVLHAKIEGRLKSKEDELAFIARLIRNK